MSDTEVTARSLTCPSGHVYSAREPRCPVCAGATPPQRSGEGPSDAVAASIAAAAASLMVEARLAGKPMAPEAAIDAALALYRKAGERLLAPPPTISADPVYMNALVATRPEDLLGRLLAGRYSVETVLGRGGQAVVYRATDTTNARKVALKVMLLSGRDDLWRDFLQEAKAARKVQHPAIVRILDEVEADGLRFLVFEYVEGETLRAVLKRMGALPLETAVFVVQQAAQAIAAAHAASVFHTDLKPENLLVSGRPPILMVKVLDLGLAIVDRSDADGTETRVGAVAGTPLYMAPEQAQGLMLDARCDVYGLGLVLYECLTGANPYGPMDSVGKVFARKLQGPPPPLARSLPFVPPTLEALLAASLQPDRARRPADAAVFARLLAQVPVATDSDFMRT